jgi:two-component system sensor histidine kinase/response regulator
MTSEHVTSADATAEQIRILVVDDEDGVRMGVTRALRAFTAQFEAVPTHCTYQISEAASAEDALQKIADEPPQILLLDYKLPGMSGLDLLSRIDDKQLLTVMITAYASLETAITATKRGAHDFLPKPFTPAELRNVVRKTSEHLLLQREARRLAEEKRRVRFQFISVLAHELKAPLAAVEGYLHLLQDERLSADPAKRRNMIDRSLHRIGGMRKLIFDLLDMTRIESGERARELGEVELVELTRGCLDSVREEATSRDISLQLDAPATLPFRGDPSELEMLANNLLTNAVKYNRDGGRVDITLAQVEGKAHLRIADTGIGMTPEERDRVFGEFARIRNAKTRDILGSGLGLSTVHKLVKLYGGTITVESEADVGTTFDVLLPPAA